MAFIKIRGRQDPLIVDDERARKIKERKFGVEGRVVKAEPGELLEISHSSGEWTGEYARIAEIDIQKERTDRADAFEAERRKDAARIAHWLSLSAKAKAQGLSWFKLCYSGRTGDFKWEPDAELTEKLIAFQEQYYTEHPDVQMIPPSDYGDLLPPKRINGRQMIADKMRVPRDIF